MVTSGEFMMKAGAPARPRSSGREKKTLNTANDEVTSSTACGLCGETQSQNVLRWKKLHNWTIVCNIYVCSAYYSITRLTYFNANINSIRIKREFLVHFIWKVLHV